MKLLSVTFLTILFSAIMLFTPRSASASEGIIELQNISGRGERCYAMSLLIQNFSYQILVDCRNLIYPLESSQSAYVIWATPLQTTGVPPGTNVVRLGELGFGKIMIRSIYPFSGLFVTTELNSYTRIPTGPIVMQGDVHPISFLEGIIPTLIPQITQKPKGFGEILKLTPSPTPKSGGLVSGIVTALIILGAIIFFFVIVGIIIFIMYRSRRATF